VDTSIIATAAITTIGIETVTRRTGGAHPRGAAAGAFSSTHELSVSPVVERTPGGEVTLFAVQLIGEIDVGLAVEEIAKIQARAFQMNRVDLKIPPIKRSVGVGVVNLAFTLRVFRALNGKGQAAIRAKFATGVLLPGGKGTPKPGGLSTGRIAGHHALCHYNRPLKMEMDGGLERQGIARMEPPDRDRGE
jgi:hypothetical protein